MSENKPIEVWVIESDNWYLFINGYDHRWDITTRWLEADKWDTKEEADEKIEQIKLKVFLNDCDIKPVRYLITKAIRGE